MKRSLLQIPAFCAVLFLQQTIFAQGLPVFPSIAVNPATPVFNTNGVSYLNQDTAVAVGAGGMVWRSIDGGMNWAVVPTFTNTQNNNAVVMKNNYICIAGDAGSVTFSNNKGATWQIAAVAQPTVNYHGVDFSDTTFGGSVGDNGDAIIYHWVGGLGWAHIPTSQTVKLNALECYKTSANPSVDGFAFAVGDNGALSTYSFGSWTNLATSPVTTNINGVYLFSDNVTVLAVGDSGLIMRSPDYGNSWSVLNYGENEALRAISDGIVPNQFLAVGDSGVIYESLDGGFVFTKKTVGFNNTDIKSVSAKSPRGAFGGSGNVLRTFAADSTLITSVSATTLCPGDNFKVRFNLYGIYGSNNLTSVQLSDASGSFTTPVSIGTKNNPQMADSIIATIPANTSASALYKIRLATSDPMILSPVFGSSLTVKAAPNNQPILVNFTDLFVHSQAGCTYQWFHNASPMGGQTDTIVTTVGNGPYYVVITGSNGCTTTTTVFNYNATSVKALASNEINVSPNPANNQLRVIAPEYFVGKVVHIYNTLGAKISSEKLRAVSTILNVSELEPGIYFLAIENRAIKIVIAR